jgi:hypothetical protein
VHGGAAGPHRGEDRPGRRQRDHFALLRQVADQQTQLVLDAVAGPGADDVQHPNGHFFLSRCPIVGNTIALLENGRSQSWRYS